MRTTSIISTAALGAAAAVCLATAGSASAAEPIVVPELGIAGVWLTPGETAALASSPLPDLVDAVVPPSSTRVLIGPESALVNPDGSTYASNAQILGEAAAHPDGAAAVFLTNPFDPADPGAVLWVVQDW